VHLGLSIGKVGQIFEEVAEAVTGTRGMLLAYTNDHPEFRKVGEGMLAAWESGLAGVRPD